MSEMRVCPNCLAPLGEESVCARCGFDSASYTVLPHHLVPGSLVKQRYQVGRVLGEGGFGITYVGRDTVLNLKVAIKEFYMAGYVNRNHDASDTVFATLGTHRDTFTKNKEKFLSEARVLARFYEEPGIVGVRDFCEENGTAYIIMDFLDGVTLKDYLEQKGRLAPADAVALLMPVMRSLERVHADGIIHRDISPDNIMVLPDGRTKLLDFGAARAVSQTDIKSLSVILKPGYAPEEQYRSKGHQGPWTDVYALAATLYRCIVGQAPDDAMERMYRDLLPAPAATEAACPVAISNVIMKGLAVRQPDRYQDVGSFLTDLEAALKDPGNADLAPDLRQVPGGARPAAPAGDHTVLADLPTGHTVLADSEPVPAPKPAPAPKAEPKPEPAPAPAPKTEPKPAPKAEPKPQPEPAPQAEPRPESKPKAEAKPESTPEPAAPADKVPGGKKSGGKKIFLLIAAVVIVLIIAAVACQGGKSGGSTSASDITTTEPFQMPTVAINGVTVEVPGSVQPLLDAGWVFDDASYETLTLEPGEHADFVQLVNEYGTIYVNLVNQGLNTLPVADCTLVVVDASTTLLNKNYLNKSGNTLTLSNGLTLGTSTPEDIATACPDARKDGDSYIRQNETNREKYTFDADGVLRDAYLRVSDDVKPDSLAEGEVSRERPAEYDDPAFMEAYGLQDFSVQSSLVSGTLPLTVEDFTNQGWTVERQPDYLPANSYATVYLRYDVRTTLEVQAANYTGNAIDPKYGMIKYLAFSWVDDSGYQIFKLDDLTLQYQGKTWVELGKTTRQQAQDTAKELGLSATADDMGQLIVKIGDNNRKICLTFNSDDLLVAVSADGEYGGSSYNYESEETNG